MKEVDEAIQKVVNSFKKNPLIFHCERDVQALLYAELLEQFPSLYETSHPPLENRLLKTIRVHCEYNIKNESKEGSKTKLIDLVVFSEDHVEKIKHKNRLLYEDNDLGAVCCDALIEIKFENGYRSPTKGEDPEKDFGKLKAAQLELHEEYGKKPDLYFLYFIFYWKEGMRKNIITRFLTDLPELLDEGEKINTFISIGPKYIWKSFIEQLEMDSELTCLEFTI